MRHTETQILSVAVTGGIASGKTSVCRLFEKRGARIIDADEIGREVVEERSGVLPGLVEVLGREILNEQGSLNRKALARIVFSDRRSLAALDRLVHPFLIDEIRKRIDALANGGFDGVVVTDAALIFEWNLVEVFDAIVVVSCSEDSQLTRISSRDSLDVDEALSRIKSQIPQAEKIARADFHIVNEGFLEELEEQADRVWKRLLERLEARRGGRV